MAGETRDPVSIRLALSRRVRGAVSERPCPAGVILSFWREDPREGGADSKTPSNSNIAHVLRSTLPPPKWASRRSTPLPGPTHPALSLKWARPTVAPCPSTPPKVLHTLIHASNGTRRHGQALLLLRCQTVRGGVLPSARADSTRAASAARMAEPSGAEASVFACTSACLIVLSPTPSSAATRSCDEARAPSLEPADRAGITRQAELGGTRRTTRSSRRPASPRRALNTVGLGVEPVPAADDVGGLQLLSALSSSSARVMACRGGGRVVATFPAWTFSVAPEGREGECLTTPWSRQVPLSVTTGARRGGSECHRARTPRPPAT
jgi:hypothetical protein